MFKSIIYIEQSLKNNQSAKIIIDKVNPDAVIKINNYKEILNQTNSDWLFNKRYQKIILAKREHEFYYKGAGLTSNMGYTHFYYNTLALNCLYHCEYCYLQGMYNTPHLVLFLNNNDFIFHTQQLIKKLNSKIYLALSYDTDLPALEKYYPYCQEWIEFANKEKNIDIEIRTKSANIDFIEQSKPSKNVILSFTLSPEYIQKKYEPLTPSLQQRLNAVKKAVEKNCNVMLCFDPVIYFSTYKDVYKEFFQYIFSHIDPKKIYACSIGTFRMNNDFIKRIRKNNHPSDIYYYPYKVHNKTASYPDVIKQQMLDFLNQELMSYSIKNLFIYE